MTTETPDPFDTDLQKLFAGVQPASGFEDRLVSAVRRQRETGDARKSAGAGTTGPRFAGLDRLRLPIPPAITRAAVAAAALLAVGVTGYYGNKALTQNLRYAQANREKSVSNSHQISAAIYLDGDTQNQPWDFGGGSNKFTQDFQELNNTPNQGQYSDKALKNQSTYLYDQSAGQQPSTGKDQTGETGYALDAKNRVGKGGYNTPAIATNAGKASDDTVTRNVAGLNYFHGKVESFSPNQSLDSILQPGAGKGDVLESSTTPQPVLPTVKTYLSDSSEDNLKKQEKLTRDKDQQLGINDRLNPVRKDVTGSNSIKIGEGNIIRDVAGMDSFHGFTVPSEGITLKQAYVTNLTPVAGEQQPDHALSGAAAATRPVVIDDRKIIRTGTMEFEVDRFDTAQMQITKIVLELGGFVGATDSLKLPNGKVRGSISVRVPPERLDVLVISLRALGDLKSQQITAADITKEYTDIQSELTADRAMQDRLLDLIHNGKGTVKELLAAETELGTWREKIEKAEGMIRYYNGQIGLSTLSITLSERDIQTPATTIETETADMGIEADDVEKARNAALKSIEDARGRIVEAELKRFDAGQLAARLVADVPPESAGMVIDQLKLLGKVARLEVNRQSSSETVPGREAATGNVPLPMNGAPLKIERKPTRLLISIYNLANVAPRRTTNVSLAAVDVEAAYTALVTAARNNGGRVVTSNLDRGDPVKASGELVLEFPPDKFDAAMTALHAQGDVLNLTLTENPDTQNSTDAKQGLSVHLKSLAAVPARESITQKLAAVDVSAAYQALLDAAGTAHARVQSAQLDEQDRQNITADLLLELPRNAQAEFERALANAGGTIARTSARAAEADGTVDSKVQLRLSIVPSDHLSPRETTRLQLETTDVDKAAGDAQAAALAAGGRVLESTINKDRGKGVARLILDLPLNQAGSLLQQLRSAGTVRSIDASKDAQATAGPLAHAHVYVEFVTSDAIVADATSPWASIRHGLTTSINGLLWSLQWVVVGLCLIGPWVVILWIFKKLWSRRKRTEVIAPAAV